MAKFTSKLNKTASIASTAPEQTQPEAKAAPVTPEAKPAEAKPAEAKPAEAKPAEAKPAVDLYSARGVFAKLNRGPVWDKGAKTPTTIIWHNARGVETRFDLTIKLAASNATPAQSVAMLALLNGFPLEDTPLVEKDLKEAESAMDSFIELGFANLRVRAVDDGEIVVNLSAEFWQAYNRRDFETALLIMCDEFKMARKFEGLKEEHRFTYYSDHIERVNKFSAVLQQIELQRRIKALEKLQDTAPNADRKEAIKELKEELADLAASSSKKTESKKA